MKIAVFSSKESLPFARELCSTIGNTEMTPILWEDMFELSDFTLSRLEEEIRGCDGCIAVLSRDDVVHSREKEEFIARDNVVLESGISIGSLGIKRTVLVHEPGVKVPSDLSGVCYCSTTKTINELNKNPDENKSVLRNISTKVTKHFKSLGEYKKPKDDGCDTLHSDIYVERKYVFKCNPTTSMYFAPAELIGLLSRKLEVGVAEPVIYNEIENWLKHKLGINIDGRMIYEMMDLTSALLSTFGFITKYEDTYDFSDSIDESYYETVTYWRTTCDHIQDVSEIALRLFMR